MNGSIAATWTAENPYWAVVFEGAAPVFEIASNMVQHPLWAALFGVAGVTAGDIGPVSSNGSANFNDCWNDPDSTFYPSTNEALKAEYRMAPVLQLGETISFWEGEEYNVNGYLGQTRRAIRKLDGRAKWSGHFTWQEDPP
jgi:hypothetical protein